MKTLWKVLIVGAIIFRPAVFFCNDQMNKKRVADQGAPYCKPDLGGLAAYPES
jgi:hypothetical protein